MKDEYSQLINEHRKWLNNFTAECLSRWNNLFKANHEAALCEAATRKLRFDHSCIVEPFENPASGGVDFKCSKNGNTFYVETACITKEVATDKSGLTHSVRPNKATYYAYLTRTIWQELRKKHHNVVG